MPVSAFWSVLPFEVMNLSEYAALGPRTAALEHVGLRAAGDCGWLGLRLLFKIDRTQQAGFDPAMN